MVYLAKGIYKGTGYFHFNDNITRKISREYVFHILCSIEASV